MRCLLLIAFVFVLASFVSAQTADAWDRFDCARATYLGKPLTEAAIPLPKELADFTNGEMVTVNVENEMVTGRVRNGIFSNIQCGYHRDSGVTVTLQKDTVQKIIDSDFPFKTFKQLHESGEIVSCLIHPGWLLERFS